MQTFPKCWLTRFLYTFYNRSLPVQNLFYPSTYLEDRRIFVYTKQPQIIFKNERETKTKNEKRTYKSELPLRTNPSAAHALLRTPPDKKAIGALHGGGVAYWMTGCAYTFLAEQSRVDWRLPYEQRIHIGTTTATPRRNQPTLTSQPANQPANHPASQPASGSPSLPAVSSQPPGIARTTPSTRDWKPRGEGLRVSPRARQTGGGVCWWNYFAWQKLTPCLTLALSLSHSLSFPTSCP